MGRSTKNCNIRFHLSTWDNREKRLCIDRMREAMAGRGIEITFDTEDFFIVTLTRPETTRKEVTDQVTVQVTDQVTDQVKKLLTALKTGKKILKLILEDTYISINEHRMMKSMNFY